VSAHEVSQAPFAGPVAFPGLVFDDVPRSGEALMARDAARLAAGDAAPASLLWFAWDRPTVTIGRLQDSARALDLARCAELDLPVVRRPTGGRAVLHADEWTYGAVVPLDHPALGGGLRASCRALVALVTSALTTAYGIAFDEATGGAKGPADACFGSSFGYEAVVSGRKLMGSAQRRTAGALLQQGSLLVGPGHERLACVLQGADPAQERALARGAVSLTELLGARPDPAPFRAALTDAFRLLEGTTARPL
jgi:lipoate-protein ligase A